MKYSICILIHICLSITSYSSLAGLNQPPNIILMIGDGMGVAHTTAYRYFENEQVKAKVATTVLDKLFVGMSSTYPDDKTLVTDSAAGATALSTGFKSYNGAIAVDTQKQATQTVLELAKLRGWKTGVITTVQVNHATPASFITHNESRNNYNAIADSYIDERIHGKPKFDLLLGGGLSYFQREDRDIVSELVSLDYQFVDSLNQLNQVKQLPVLGLFAAVQMPYVVDEQNVQDGRLAMMTDKALSLLAENDKPFFMMIEGGLVDWCSHQNDIACTMHEMRDFVKAVKVVKDFIDLHPNTLLVVTGDHSTGGLSVGGWDKKEWHPNRIKQIHIAISTLADKLMGQEPDVKVISKFLSQYIEFKIEKFELLKLAQARTSGSLESIKQTLRAIFNKHTMTGWTTLSHSADDVPIFAYGQGKDKFTGSMENTEIGKRLMNIIDLSPVSH